MKRFKSFVLIILLISCTFLFNACTLFPEESVYVVDIVQTEEVGDFATYTIHYSNGETALFTVKNGKDGKDGKDGDSPEIEEIYEAYKVKIGDNITYEEFLKKFLSVNETPSSNENTVEDATNIALNSAVTIWCEFPTSDQDGTNKELSVACGAGVIYKIETNYSYIVTNFHVVYSKDTNTANNMPRKIHIFQYGTEDKYYVKSQEIIPGKPTPVVDADGYPEIVYGYGAIEATYVGGEMTYDLAVIKVPTSELRKYNENVSAVKIADSYNVAETAIAIGNPEMMGFSVTQGIISVVSQNMEMDGPDEETECEFRVMRIDAAVNGGNSGGGLFNINGELIGIVNSKLVSVDIENIAFALPVDNVVPFVENILYYYDGSTPTGAKKLVLGISYFPENSHAVYNPETNRTQIFDDLEVKEVESGSLAESIGLKVGDIIKGIIINNADEITLARSYELADLLLTIRAGDKFMLTIKRGTETIQRGLTTAEGVLDNYLQEI